MDGFARHSTRAMGWGLAALTLALLANHGIRVLLGYLGGCFDAQ
jgi:hypothetical protein